MKKYSALSVHIKGLVQGVGFRPFVYRLANRNHIYGWVENGNDGVRIHAEGVEEDLGNFKKELSKEAPAASQILDIVVQSDVFQHHKNFIIRKSADYSDEITEISPDIALCDECLADIKRQPHRIDYPFINCTNCGPRFSIIRGLPYDRSKTTMEPFKMCPECEREYMDVLDRRFHAQPVACAHCGPHYELIHSGIIYTGIDNILDEASNLILSGKILAIKGMGGFHLACDAMNETAVGMLRHRKNREGKPFAVMFRNMEETRKFMETCKEEEDALSSWQRPIVIIKNRNLNFRLAKSVSNGFDTTGVMLPYMPIHYLLFERLNIPAIVLTSGNLSDEPVIIENKEAIERLASVTDNFLLYNREIYNRTDDSVMMLSGNHMRLIRRSRGFAPSPVNLSINADGIFAAGAELVNCFCLGKGQKAIMSQHIGDLKNLETLDFYTESLHRFIEMFRIKPQLVVSDLHPDYLSTRFAEEFASENGALPCIRIQHHHAHLAACMAEHGLDEKVIGFSLDGVGYGSDGNIWGFEVMECDLLDFERKVHLEYVPQPGGDMANFEPWRMALAYLHKYVDKDLESIELPFIQKIDHEKIRIIKAAIENNINSPLTSSAGRLFDAVAALTGICNQSSFHAEAPMRLENMMDLSETGYYDFAFDDIIDPRLLINGIVRDLLKKVPVQKISTRFHRSIVEVIIQIAGKLKAESGINKVVLSGGTFQNRFILSECEKKLQNINFQVYTHRKFPGNDGGIALGQLIIAAKRRQEGKIEHLVF
jgi:hydrogenase maturation protein HypF